MLKLNEKIAKAPKPSTDLFRAVVLPTLATGLSACSGVQSVLNPAGRDAQTLADLFWVLLAGAIVIWLFINGLFFYVWRLDRSELSPKSAEALIIGGGIVFPTIVLGILLTYALSTMPDIRAPGTGTLISVKGEKWWWRIEYWPEDAEHPIRSANEVVLPTGRRTEFLLQSDQVIHSFWIPVLGGKTDMFPGRETRMSLEPTEAGLYRGQCTEFCGESHALMAFSVRVLEPEAYAEWLAHEMSPASPPEGAFARQGYDTFFSEGCGGCHAIRGTPAAGRVGPDLTHLGSRASLAAGTLPVTPEAIANWVRAPKTIKPGALMPAFDHLSDEALASLGVYLAGLE